MNPITMLKSDHQKVSRLFQEHERASAGGKKAVFGKINAELSVHAELEEQIFYPAVREASRKGAETVAEGYEEHAEVKALLAEISAMDADDDEYEQKVSELRAGVEHHVEEEEGEMLPEAERALGDRLDEVGSRMQQMKQTLTSGRGAMAGGGAKRGARTGGVLAETDDMAGEGMARGGARPRSTSARKGTRPASSRGGSSRSGAARSTASRSGSRSGARPGAKKRSTASRSSARKGSRGATRSRSRGR